ncbi:hypothetical protein FZEAL_3985 [Fusarium zealandicum]|uniref:Uncharacterized protein n=1 Tax=Fusarium zealandicum TaxID=1053134 RepID=A0A8H4XL89_9HYPO|nr:hypothetical protein FZEAL_3985 [Fusarium zealandicum]
MDQTTSQWTWDLSALLQQVKSQIKLTNPSRHDAAVILATPEYAQWLEQDDFMSEFVELLSGSEKMSQFHVLGAVVDFIAPPMPKNTPIHGISILRGSLDSILPELWTQAPPRAREDANKVAALTIDLGNPHLTLPLANTTFLNHRTSTLIASRYDLSGETPKLVERSEKHWQQVTLPLKEQLPSVGDLGIWAPLVPLTHPRVVTESFGNIVRRVNVDDDSVPASNELEPAVDELHSRKSDLVQAPMGVWAMITPPTFGSNISRSTDPDPDSTFDEKHNVTDLITSTSSRLHELYGQGGRLYQILSGGGGWGAKKGLLSLDPQRTHFALSEEEEMQRFIQAMDGGNFVPVGSKIQFFASTETSTDGVSGTTGPGVVFGTASKVEPSADDVPSESESTVLDNHFGALSSDGVFVTSPDAAAETTPGFNNDWKLNVPHSRIFVGGQCASGLCLSYPPKPFSLQVEILSLGFATIDPRDMRTSCDTEIMVGEPGESYIYVEPEVGNAIRVAIAQLGSSVSNHSETNELESLLFPRIDISKNLGQTKSKISSATLWLSGNWHAITLDGTPDASIAIPGKADCGPPTYMSRIPAGVILEQFDIEEPAWNPLLTECDLIHMRMLLGGIQTDVWPQIYNNAFK